MNLKNFGLVVILIIIISSVILLLFHFLPNPKKELPTKPILVNINGKMKVKYPQDFTLVLVGDSMTEYLGNSDEIRAYLKNYYPEKTFEVLNYGFGSTNILSLPQRLTEKTFHTREFRPILDIDFDVILIESFGHNPLSDYPLKEGLQKQTEALEKAVATIKKENPRAKIIFLATLGPNKKIYAYRAVDLTPEKREEWANERIAYIKNHIQYAISHNIPLINIFQKSLTNNGDGNMIYINQTDDIHPSFVGVDFIGHEIGNFIHDNNILPQ